MFGRTVTDHPGRSHQPGHRRRVDDMTEALPKHHGVGGLHAVHNTAKVDIEEPMPVRGVARQSRDFQAEHDPGFFETHFRDQLLKSFAIRRLRGGLTEVAVDDDDALNRPA